MTLDYTPVRLSYARIGTVNKIRTWSRRNNATVEVSRYAKDAYEGRIKVWSPWNEGRDQHIAKVAELKSLIVSTGGHLQ